ncbi:hypothetical protein EGW08_005032 [Elysia chlorotica]|uniref:PABC domain-containing protein n=1 Tax=Elysia chlorotica TaxID=188477 RepID=A0A3S1BMN9_ELYCH|nr:hypothetical protein EGW08_005032 [Elysia chlorotica]
MSKTIEYKCRESARSTKEVLGEHLYQKVSQALSQYELKPELQVGSRLTGMMLELPARDVTSILASDGILRSCVSQALSALVQMFPELESVAAHFREQSRTCLTQEDIGSLIYTSVAKLEPTRAAKITGMLLELDTPTLLSFLNQEDAVFPSAVEKAKRALEFSADKQPSIYSSDGGSADKKTEGLEATCMNSGVDDDGDDDVLLARLGAVIYDEALLSHPECAANIAGMLLELGVSALRDLVNDKDALVEAINKSYQVWHASLP